MKRKMMGKYAGKMRREEERAVYASFWCGYLGREDHLPRRRWRKKESQPTRQPLPKSGVIEEELL